MKKRSIGLIISIVGTLCALLIVLSDFFRGRPFQLGFAQVGLLVVAGFIIGFGLWLTGVGRQQLSNFRQALSDRRQFSILFYWLLTVLLLVFGYWRIAIQPLGQNLSRIQGDLGDARFNNYILEHDYLWLTGKEKSLLDAPFFYPYPKTIAYSENHFGSMLFYSIFRSMGLDRETAFQFWFLLGYLLCLITAVVVLQKMKLHPLAIGLGAFIFTFSLPVLAQEDHAQLVYRFCIPLALFSLWQWMNHQKAKHLLLVTFWWVWQFYLSIYLGFFLTLLMAVVIIGFPIDKSKSIKSALLFWPKCLQKTWHNLTGKKRIPFILSMGFFFATIILLFIPYIQVSRSMDFSRTWEALEQLLPTLPSYLIADRSIIWQNVFSSLTTQIQVGRVEHQLFLGFTVLLALLIGLAWNFPSKHKQMANLYIGAAIVIFLITLNIHGFSLYKLLWYFPGGNSIRAVSRVVLVLMWPIALFVALEMDSLLKLPQKSIHSASIVLFFIFLFLIEVTQFSHSTTSKVEVQSLISALKAEIRPDLPADPILYYLYEDNHYRVIKELDAMIVGQELGVPVLNGYSGYFPPGYGPFSASNNCGIAIERIENFMMLFELPNSHSKEDILNRIVPIGPKTCAWD